MLHCPAFVLAATLLATDARIESQHLLVEINPSAHTAKVVVALNVTGEGELTLRLHRSAKDIVITTESGETTFQIDSSDDEAEHHTIHLSRSGQAAERVTITYLAHFEQDVEGGEVAGQIHNKSVNAHIGENGIFLSDGSSWHPQWVDVRGRPQLMDMSVDVKPIEGFVIVCSGEPIAQPHAINDPVWTWMPPRKVDGLAIVGNRHVIVGESHMTEYGPVDIVMHTTAEHEPLATMFIEATKSYLDLYVPLLGPFPYRRFSIVENFFSSGFAYPGFTVLGPQVVGMAPRSLAPGYLDHELIHNWWGNGVYVDPDDGNWCEALTSYCANYYRRVAEEGEDAGRDYRRGVLMKLSTDPETFDNGALDTFGRDPKLNRFVGYDKGAFVFSMLEGGGAYAPIKDERASMFRALRRFADQHMGHQAGWDDLQSAFEVEFNTSLRSFFNRWVREHTVPRTEIAAHSDGPGRFSSAYGSEMHDYFVTGQEDGRSWIEVDPECRLYRVLPPGQLVPTIAGTLGPGGVKVSTAESREEVTAYLPRLSASDSGENLMLIGGAALAEHADLLARTVDPITASDDAFTVGETTYDQPRQAVLHTMAHPEQPGRFITVFLSNGEPGWGRLRLITFYTRDSTVVWENGQVIQRRVYEPDRRFWLD